MKSNKLSYVMALAIALTFTAAGCKKNPVGVTQLPKLRTEVGQAQPIPPADNTGMAATPSGNPTETGGGALTDAFNIVNYNQDPGALAAQTVHFDYDSSVVKQNEQEHVTAVETALQSEAAAKLLIEGHCDERGTEEYNRSLGERRALALREALAKAGIDPNRVKTISYGKDKPVAQGHSESAWKQNRRGVFILLHPK